MTDNSSSNSPGLLSRLGPKGIAGIALAILVVVFIVENSAKTHIRFIVGPKVSAPLWLALLLTAVAGGIAGWLLEKRQSR